MDKPFPAYQGDEPYVFVCYSHDDSEVVYTEMVWLREHGVNLWYDEGISPGEEWSEELGQAIDNATVLLFFLTPNSVSSRHCRNEVHFAQNHDTSILAVHLEQTRLPAGLDLAIGSSQGILAHDLRQETYRPRLLQALHIPSDQAGSSTPSAAKGQTSSVTPKPSKSMRNRLLTVSTIAIVVIVSLIGFQSWNGSTTEGRPNRSGIPRLAVLSFENQSDDPQDRYFSDGLAEDIATALSRFPLLTIIPPEVAAKYNEVEDTVVADKLGVRYVVRGSVREARVSVRLVDPRDGSQLWADSYPRNFEKSEFSDAQAEIAERVAAALANSTGVVITNGLQDLRRRPIDSSEPYNCVLLGHAYIAIHTDQTHREARDCLERAVETDENHADAWAHLAYLYQEEFHHNRNVKPRSLDRALRAAKRAVELDQSNMMGRFALAMTHFSRGEVEISLNQMDRALALNPTDTMILGALAVNSVFAGDIEKGLKLVDRARNLHRTPPSYLYEALAAAHFLRGEYEQSLLELSSWSPSLPTEGLLFKAASLGMLGRKVEAQKVLDELLASDEVFAKDPQGELRRLFPASETVDAVADGLANAGLKLEIRPG